MNLSALSCPWSCREPPSPALSDHLLLINHILPSLPMDFRGAGRAARLDKQVFFEETLSSPPVIVTGMLSTALDQTLSQPPSLPAASLAGSPQNPRPSKTGTFPSGRNTCWAKRQVVRLRFSWGRATASFLSAESVPAAACWGFLSILFFYSHSGQGAIDGWMGGRVGGGPIIGSPHPRTLSTHCLPLLHPIIV